ncbi:MAG: endolytic transglycosylase MltG [Chloroflexota bacterium]
MNRSRSSCARFFVLIVIGLAILAVGLVFNVISAIPTKAENLFGPATSRLSTSQHYLLSYKLVNSQDLLLTPVDPTGAEVPFTITPDEPINSILLRLQSHGLIPDSEAARNYLVYTGLDTRIQTGEFTLSPAAAPIEVITALLDTTPGDATLVILPGWRLEEIAESLPTTGLEISAQEFIQAANGRGYHFSFIGEVPTGAKLEGFFPPGSYQLERGLSAEQVISYLLDQFDQLLPNEIEEGIQQQGLTVYQAVVLASIIEREAVLEEEMPIIASVFYNRLAIGMKLETDPTVQYALGYNTSQATWWTNPLSYTDLTFDGPHNTYLYNGLPPTPIANPSLTALQAVAYPAQTPYYYFRAACDGSGRHQFSQSFEEHLGNACQ